MYPGKSRKNIYFWSLQFISNLNQHSLGACERWVEGWWMGMDGWRSGLVKVKLNKSIHIIVKNYLVGLSGWVLMVVEISVGCQ